MPNNNKEHKNSCKTARRKGIRKHLHHDTGLPCHAVSSGHTFDFANPSVLAYEPNAKRRKIFEALDISLDNNLCNLNTGRYFDENWLAYLKFFKSCRSSESLRSGDDLEVQQITNAETLVDVPVTGHNSPADDRRHSDLAQSDTTRSSPQPAQ